MPLVMLIEDEPVLRSSMARGLARLPNVEVIDASLFGDAVRLLDAERPDLIVSDLDLPDGSGVEILNVLDRLGLRVPVVFVTAYLGSFRGQLPSRPDVEVHEKPLPLARLREVVLRRLDMRGDATVSESPFSLADYLQLACMGRHSVELTVNRDGLPVGHVVVVQGRIWSARAGDLDGEDAVARLAFGVSGVATAVRRLAREPGPRTVTRPWQHILLDAARVHDETSRERGTRRSTGPVPALPRPGNRLAEAATRPSAARRSASGSARPATPERARPARRQPSTPPAAAPSAADRARRPSFVAGPLPGGLASAERRPASPPAADEVPALVPDLPRTPTLPDGEARAGARPAKAVRVVDARAVPAVGTPRPLDPSAPPRPPAPPPAATGSPPAATGSPPGAEADFDTLIDRGLDAMLGRDYGAAWTALSQADALRPGVPTVLANLARLRQLGYGGDS